MPAIPFPAFFSAHTSVSLYPKLFPFAFCPSCSRTVPISPNIHSTLRCRVRGGGGSLAEVFLSFPHVSYSHTGVSDLHSHTGTRKHEEARVESSIDTLSTEKSRRKEDREEGSQGCTCCSATGFDFVQCSLEMSGFLLHVTYVAYLSCVKACLRHWTWQRPV